MLAINTFIPLLILAVVPPLTSASPFAFLAHQHDDDNNNNNLPSNQVAQEEVTVVRTVVGVDGHPVIMTYTPATTTAVVKTTITTIITASTSIPVPPSSPKGQGPRETTISQPERSGGRPPLELRADDDGFATEAAETATTSSSSSTQKATPKTTAVDDETAAAAVITAAPAAPPTDEPTVDSALAEQGYSQETFYECKTFAAAATAVHCGWHEPVVYVGAAARGKGTAGGAGGAAVVAAACGVVMNAMLGGEWW